MTEHIKEKLDLFAQEKYCIVKAGDSIPLSEGKRDGEAEIVCTCQKEALVFPKPEENVLPYLDGRKKGATACADKFIFVSDGNAWNLHVMEIKKTINTASFAKSREQYRMGIYNARALSGFLGINVNQIKLHSAFREDAISDLPLNELIALRAAVHPDLRRLIDEWKAGQCSLQIDGTKSLYCLNKIPLDTFGHGSAAL